MEEDSMCFSQWESAREMDQAWCRWRQFLMKWLPVTGPVPVWFLFMRICERTDLCPPHFFQLALLNLRRESLPHWKMLQETCYSVFGKNLTTKLTCAMSQAMHILNTNEIGPRINLCFIELDLAVFKITAFKMMLNFLGHPIINIL